MKPEIQRSAEPEKVLALTSGFEVNEWIIGSLPDTLAKQPFIDLEGEWYRSEEVTSI